MSLGTTTTFAATESSVIQSALRKLGQLGDWVSGYTDIEFGLDYMGIS